MHYMKTQYWQFLFPLLCFFFISKVLQAQCSITVDAGQDQVVCNLGETVSLNGSVSGNFLDFNWTPIAGLDNPLNLTPNATVTGTATYTLTAYAEDPSAPNLVNNPAFEAGNAGFTSTYTYNPAPITPGTYFITTSPSLVFSSFPPCDDHTFGNGTGNMMLCNGTGSPADVWCQTIPVAPNTYYVMSGWVTASPISPPIMQFSVNGILVGTPFSSNGVPCGWEQFSAIWFSGAAVSATLCVTDQNSSGNGLFGDDFAIDDIYFAEACSVSDEVEVSIAEVDAVLPLTTILPCNSLPNGIVLDGSASTTGPNISYQWDGANIVSGANTHSATVNEPGSYTLTVTYNDGFTTCTDMASIEVLDDPNFVLAFAVALEDIDCFNTIVTIDGTGTFEGPTINYSWTPMAGIVSGENTLFPEVNQGGTYTLFVTNSITGCTATAEVTVEEDTEVPTATAEGSGVISCMDTIQILDGTGSSAGSDFEYEWTALNFGNIIFGANTIDTCVVDTAGTYQLLVTNIVNGCTATDTIVVEENVNLPEAFAEVQSNIDCINNSSSITGNGSSIGDSILYLWTTINGNIVSGDSTLTAIVDQGGDYVLTVSDTLSGCSAIDTISVLENSALPLANAISPEELTCLASAVQLDGTSSSTGVDFMYLWTTVNGNILNGDTSLMPMVDAAGHYLLTVTDTTNGCTATDTAFTISNLTPPISEAGNGATIDCANNPEFLDGNGSSLGADFTYLWTTNDGNILSGETSLMPQVSAAGIYFLTVTNTLNGCISTDSVVVSAEGNAPTATVEVLDILDCNTGTLTIDGSGSSSGPDISLSWFTLSGNIINGETTLTPEVDAPGTYTLTLIDQTNNCLTSVSITVEQDTMTPTVNIAQPVLLNCYQALDTLDATASSQGANFTQNWTTQNGNIVNGATTLQPLIAASGIYVLTINNSDNGCQATQQIMVLEDFLEPVADAGVAQSLTCNDPTAQLDGTASSQGNEFDYQWTSVIGNFISGQNTLEPVVDMEGTYILEVTNLNNGCSAVAGVSVNIFTDFPQVNIEEPDTLGCINKELTLSATASTGTDFQYLWTTLNGNILDGGSGLSPIIDAAGQYELIVTDTSNGCAVADTVLVFENSDVPTAQAGAAFTLSCAVTDVILDGTGSSTGTSFSYLWSSQNGNIVSDEMTLTPTINAPGIYLLTVTDNSNGCTATDIVIISQDANAPTANAGQPDSLTCNIPALDLNGTGSSTGGDFSYLWTTQNGNIVSGETILTPQIDAPGTYLLTVFNNTNNCQTISSVQILDATEGPDIFLLDTVSLTCMDTVLVLSATSSVSNASYFWTTTNGNIIAGEMTPTPLIDEPGEYLLTVSDLLTGCTSIASSMVIEDTNMPFINLDFPMPLTCEMDFVNLAGWGSSSGPDFSYLWTTQNGNILGDDTQIFATANQPGDYTFAVTDVTNGCTASAGLTVVEDKDLPDAVANAPFQLGCNQTEVMLDGSGSSTGPEFSYLWITNGNIVSGENTLSPIVDASGDYLLIVTNTENSCSQTDTVTVTENGDAPEIILLQPELLTCLTTEIIIDASGSVSGLDYLNEWTTTSGNIISGATTLLPTVDAPGEYTLTITNTQNGCTATSTTTVFGNTTPPVATAGIDLVLDCDNMEIEIQGNLTAPQMAVPNWTFVLEPGYSGNPFVANQLTLNPIINLPGIYTLMVTDPINGCTVEDEMTVTSSLLTGFSFEMTEPDCLTSAGTITFTGQQGGTPPYLYSVDGLVFSSQTVFDNLPPGAYSLTVQDDAGCEISEDAVIPLFQPFEVSLDPEITVSLGEEIHLVPLLTLPINEISNFIWSPAEGLSCTDCLDPFLLPTQNNIYQIEVIDSNGCSAIASVSIMVKEPNINVFVPNVFSPNGDGINDLFFIFANEKLVVIVSQFHIFSRWGETVFENFDFPPNDVEHGWDGTHRSKSLDSGVFTWFAEIVLVNGETKMFQGDVTIIK